MLSIGWVFEPNCLRRFIISVTSRCIERELLSTIIMPLLSVLRLFSEINLSKRSAIKVHASVEMQHPIIFAGNSYISRVLSRTLTLPENRILQIHTLIIEKSTNQRPTINELKFKIKFNNYDGHLNEFTDEKVFNYIRKA